MLLVVQADEDGTQQGAAFKVEELASILRGQPQCLGFPLFPGHVPQIHSWNCIRWGWMNHLNGLPIHHWKTGSPGDMTPDKLVKAPLEHRNIKRAREVNGHAFIIYRSIGHELAK